MMADTQGTALEQSSLTGDSAERVECEYYEGCTSPALFRGDPMLRDGSGGYAREETLMCESCADEFSEEIDATIERLKPSERYASNDEPETIWIVAANFDGDPHPHILGVFESEEPAEDLMDDCRQTIGGPHPIAWQKFEREVQ